MRQRPASGHESRRIDDLARALVDHEVELIPGVAETLAGLATRHRLVLLTKGVPEEQQRKIEASNLGQHFGSVRVVPEKHVEVYRRLTVEQSFRPELTWMIGDSPKSDILPARAAGLGAVLIP
ncbi:MAG TPA: HAD hydrolase-like protein [Actinopolymorphaceae bacterium]